MSPKAAEPVFIERVRMETKEMHQAQKRIANKLAFEKSYCPNLAPNAKLNKVAVQLELAGKKQLSLESPFRSLPAAPYPSAVHLRTQGPDSKGES